jgi:hypothetical protein
MKLTKTTLYKTSGEPVTLTLTSRAAADLSRSLHLCFYDRQGKPHPEPIGAVQVHSETGVCLWSSPANGLLPIIREESVRED